MSIIGTSVAAGVAQAAHNAQQVGRAQDRQSTQAARDARLQRDRFQSQLLSLEETESSSALQVHIDDQMPDHQAPSYQEPLPRQPQPEAGADDLPAASEGPVTLYFPGTPAGKAQLYRHIDVQA